MADNAARAVAVVGVGAILPDAPNAPAFWSNVKNGRYSITEVSPGRWDPELYYDPDPKAPDKTYSKIGGWVRDWTWDPFAWKFAVPPKVSEAMDDGQKWAIACTREALADYGYPARPLDQERTAVVLGNAMAGEFHYFTAFRIYFPEFAELLRKAPSFVSLPEEVRRAMLDEFAAGVDGRFPRITEDTMPGELGNILAGRVANLFNFRGPNFITDAACASAMAAMSSACEGLIQGDYDAVVSGGIDRNMGASAFVKFCKIGALSATGTRPYAEGADGFVMGEGAAVFLLKRLADAERDGDRVYAVIRALAGSSDGKGKGITAPNPAGQKLAIERAWRRAGLAPDAATLIEGHGTSTRVGDVAEVESLHGAFDGLDVPAGAIPLGSVKSNIGHLKAAAGAAGLLKAILALRERELPPSLNFDRPNPDIDFERSPFRVNTELRQWDAPDGAIRRAGVSAFGFGGTNFHAVLEEYVPGRSSSSGARIIAASEASATTGERNGSGTEATKAPLRGALLIGDQTVGAATERLRAVKARAEAGEAPAPHAPARHDLLAPERVAIDFADAADLVGKSEAALRALAADDPAVWRALKARGIFRGTGPAPKVAFLYTGQGSQYVNMLKELRRIEPIVADVFEEADRVMTPLLGKPLSDYIFVDGEDPSAVAAAEADLMQTAITQPAVLAADSALTKLLAAYGVEPDMVMGHSLGEYGALVAAGALPFESALEAVSARGREMTKVSVADNGAMAAVFAPMHEVERILGTVDGYAVIANLNSNGQAVVGGATGAVERAVQAFVDAGYQAVRLPVSHAFHTSIVAPASQPLRAALQRLHLRPARKPIVANVSGQFYPMGDGVVEEMLDILAAQVASPVQFVKGLHSLYEAGARVFVETGPKKALQGFVDDVLGDRPDVVSLFTNHPKVGDIVSFNQALCGLYAAGLGAANGSAVEVSAAEPIEVPREAVMEREAEQEAPAAVPAPAVEAAVEAASEAARQERTYAELGKLFAGFLERGRAIYEGRPIDESPVARATEPRPVEAPSIVITGAALGLPGPGRVFDDENVGKILRGEQLIGPVPEELRRAMLDKHITRLVKRENGDPSFEAIDQPDDAIKLAGRAGEFDLEEEFGVDADRVPALDRSTRLAIGAGIDALRDAGIPLVMHYRTTHKGTKLPDRWGLPDDLRDETGIVFASAFPGYDSFARDLAGFHTDRTRREQLAALEEARSRIGEANGQRAAAEALDRLIASLRASIEADPYEFDRRFLFKSLSMGHAQFAEIVGARGPNTQINSACASTTQGIALAQDWIRAGRCRRVIVIAADDATSDAMMEWIGAGFLASGAAATDDIVEDAATPFDRRRHGMIIGMGAAALVVESETAARERGIRPICEVLGTVTANSAFHGSRLDVEHISSVMETLVADAERRWGITRDAIAGELVFVSHETYTPARGGSAAAEVDALRRVFGSAVDRIVVANTKGFTGHPMGVGIEDIVAVKALETGMVPPVPNYREVDPELGMLNLSKGGAYPIRYALRLAAGFGSQISMSLLRWAGAPGGVRRAPDQLGYAYRILDPAAWATWLRRVAGASQEDLEIVQRRLRVRAPAPQSTQAPPAEVPTRMSSIPVEPPPPLTSSIPVEPSPPHPEAPVVVDRLQPDEVRERVLALVADKTGYPQDDLDLDLDLDLEADLGVDTVKQAQVFATIREAYAIPRDETLKLRDFPTLAHVIQFVMDRAGGSGNGGPPDGPVAQEVAPAAASAANVGVSAPKAVAPTVDVSPAEVESAVLALVADKTGYPRDMLDLDLDLEADLGVDTVKQAEVFATIREAYAIPRDETLKLRDFPTLAHVIQFVTDRAPRADATTTEEAEPVVATGGAPVEPVVATGESAAETAILIDEPQVTPAAGTFAKAGISPDEVRERVLDLVADKTGYPQDMLDLDLDLEADLGVDTVKQAEIFATIREAYTIPRDETLKLRDFPTLAHVIQFVMDRAGGPGDGGSPDGREGPRPATKPALAPAESGLEPAVNQYHDARAGIEAAEEALSRVPVPELRPPLELCAATETSLDSRTRVILMQDRSGVGVELGELLRRRGVTVLTLEEAPQAERLVETVDRWLSEGDISGVYWLPALDEDPPLEEMEIDAWRESLRIRAKLLHATMRALRTPGFAPFLVSATRLGGMHGYGEDGATNPTGGAVTGFTKAYAREAEGSLAKAVDFESKAPSAEVAARLLDETLSDPGAVEIGYHGGLRWTVGLEERPAADGTPGLPLGPETVFVVTGAAGSIVSAIVADLAQASGASFHLLDIAPEPDVNDPDVARFVADREGLKRDLFERMKAAGRRPTPVAIERELAGIERKQAALSAVRAIRDAGGAAWYHQLDLSDARAVTEAIGDIRERHGGVDVLLHAAGLEISHLLPDKEPREFDLVMDVKADGWFNLVRALRDVPLGATVVFSSVAGRFGNAGQTDYSAANDLLCKSTSNLRLTRPGTRGIAIDWTAWAGIGMASRGSIPKMMELAGIDMLPPEAGIPVIRRELVAGGTRGELVIGNRLGVLTEEWDERGGIDPSRVGADGAGPMVETVLRMGVHEGLVVETTLDPAEQPFLDHHRIDGTPVLPGVMGIEVFAEAAALALPGWHVAAVEDVAFEAPFKFYRSEPRTLTVSVHYRPAGSDVVARCSLIGSRTLPNHAEPQLTTHFTGTVRLTRQPGQALHTQRQRAAIPGGRPITAEAIYRVYFHGPAYRVLDSVEVDEEGAVGLLATELPIDHQPASSRLTMAPRLIELAFQTAGMWELAKMGRFALPARVERVSVLADPSGAVGRLSAVVTPRGEGDCFDSLVVDSQGNAYLWLEGYRTVELPGAVDPAVLATLALIPA